MKKLFLISTISLLNIGTAYAAPTIYGKAIVTADYQDLGRVDTTVTSIDYVNGVKNTTITSKSSENSGKVSSLSSTDSRIGIRGSEPLTPSTDVVYQLEYGISIDDAAGGKKQGMPQNQLWSRDTYLGIANKQYGTLTAGRISMLDDAINYVNLSIGGMLGGNQILPPINGVRLNKTIGYTSPDYQGFQVLALYTMANEQENSYLSNHEVYSLGFHYEPTNKPYKVAATYATAGKQLKAGRVSGSYQFNDKVGLNVLYQNTDYNTSQKENAYAFSTTYKTKTPWTAYLQGDILKDSLGQKDNDANRVILGGKYAFNPNTTGYLYTAYYNQKNTAIDSNLVAGTGTITATKTKQNSIGIGTGLEYNF